MADTGLFRSGSTDTRWPQAHAQDDEFGEHDSDNEHSHGSSNVSLDRVKLQQNLSLLDAVMIIVGIIIGSGIFISPKGVIAGVGSVGATVLVWVSCGFLSLLGALSFAELGTMIRENGGMYIYIYRTYGSFVGFLVFWTLATVVDPAGNAVMAFLFSHYTLYPLYPDPDCPPPKAAVKLVAMSGIWLMMFINFQLLESDAVAYSFGAQVLGNFTWVIPVSVVLSCLGSLNGALLTMSRLFFAAARVGQSPNFLATIDVRQLLPCSPQSNLALTFRVPALTLRPCHSLSFNLFQLASFPSDFHYPSALCACFLS
ncbi:large neutral amino acids transporter small subunit 1-like [Diadema setosum]|uniref:large neutral amino acids transporter small subunit 1-like n=1 Tax=Diadema setosum TaxID=31175 RepID=UPI003B3A6615